MHEQYKPQTHKYDTIVLDCDGVIFDSNQIKLDAFKKTLTSFDETIVASFLESVKRNFGKSRYELLRKFFSDFAKVQFDEAKFNSLLAEYSAYVVEGYSSAPFTMGFWDFINSLQGQRLYVASGSDQEELRRVFASRGIHNLFSSIYGSPTPKPQILERIAHESAGKNILFVGDSKADFEAANGVGVDFVFLSGYSTDLDTVTRLAKQYKIPVFFDFGSLMTCG